MVKAFDSRSNDPGSIPGQINIIVFYRKLRIMRCKLTKRNHTLQSVIGSGGLTDRATDYESGGSRFESWPDRYFFSNIIHIL